MWQNLATGSKKIKQMAGPGGVCGWGRLPITENKKLQKKKCNHSIQQYKQYLYSLFVIC